MTRLSNHTSLWLSTPILRKESIVKDSSGPFLVPEKPLVNCLISYTVMGNYMAKDRHRDPKLIYSKTALVGILKMADKHSRLFL
jgi:hypothetical protein